MKLTRKEISARYHARHRDRLLAAYSPTRAREFRLRREYGLTIASWDALFVGQGSCCAICKAAEPGSAKGWHTDHDHETGVVRGILCKQCNTVLGALGDTSAKVAARVNQILEYVK